jgi:hypothetical protein
VGGSSRRSRSVKESKRTSDGEAEEKDNMSDEDEVPTGKRAVSMLQNTYIILRYFYMCTPSRTHERVLWISWMIKVTTNDMVWPSIFYPIYFGLARISIPF